MHLQRQIDRINRRLLELGDRVGQAVKDAIHAIQSDDIALAESVIENDALIDLAEVEIEEECLQTLALNQPVAYDLRYLVATLKLNNDLERIGDLAVNIAEAAVALSKLGGDEPPPYDLEGMGRIVRLMVDNSQDALVSIDSRLAEQVRQRDDEVDQMHREMYRKIENAIRRDPELVQRYILFLNVSRHLERIADHAVNIAEDVIYLAEGRVPRRRHSEGAGLE